MNKFEMQTPPNMLEFRHTSVANEWVMRITADRRVEVNEDVEVTDAAKKVLEAMQHMLMTQRTWVGLTDEDIRQLEKENTVGGYHGDYCPTWDLIEATEAKLKEKNT